MDLMSMMMHIADTNAAEFKARDARSPLLQKKTVTAALLENQEWEAFKAKLRKRSRLLDANAPVSADGAPVEDSDTDEDDVDMFLSLIDTLEGASARGAGAMTVSEIVRALQRDKVLSLEFSGTARAQTKRLLNKLREMNRVWSDPQGRWSLL